MASTLPLSLATGCAGLARLRTAFSQRLVAVLLVLLASQLLVGCALSPKKASAQQDSQSLLTRQFEAVEAGLRQLPAGQTPVLFIGSAQHSQSQAFERDVLLTQQKLQAIEPQMLSIILSNELQNSRLVHPFATLHTLGQTFERVSAWSRQRPLKVVLLISTHGHVNLLSSNVANEYYAPVRPPQLRAWLDALDPATPTVVLLSACYSGSFVPALTAPHRLVMTASAADRHSFGCEFRSANTYFVGELFGPRFNAQQTWRANFEAASLAIEQREKAMKLSPPSQPQLSLPARFESLSVRDFLAR
jgi:hypothetical protein